MGLKSFAVDPSMLYYIGYNIGFMDQRAENMFDDE